MEINNELMEEKEIKEEEDEEEVEMQQNEYSNHCLCPMCMNNYN